MPATVRILIVEDNPDDAARVEREVRRTDMTCTFRRVDTRERMVAAVREFTPDVILTDHPLPTFSARDALQVGQQLSPGTPVIVVTGRLGDEPAVQYLQLGAADYVVKDHLHRLGPAVLRALDIKRSSEAQARAQQLQAATYRIAQAAMSTPGLEDLLPVVHQIVGELMPAQNFYIALYDPVHDLLSFPYAVDERDQDFPSKKPGKGLTEYVLRTGQPLLVTPEVHAELERRGEVELIGAPSIDWVGVPLQTGDHTIGVLAVETYSPGVRYGEREKEILQFVSTQVAMAIERRRTAEQLLESERKYRLLFETNPEPMFVYDFDTLRILAVNGAAVARYGYSEPEFLQLTLRDIRSPEEQARLDEELAQRSADGAVRTGVRHRTKDGKPFEVDLVARPLEFAGRRARLVLARDVSAQRQLEEQLRQSQKMEAVGQLAG